MITTTEVEVVAQTHAARRTEMRTGDQNVGGRGHEQKTEGERWTAIPNVMCSQSGLYTTASRNLTMILGIDRTLVEIGNRSLIV